MKYIFQSFAFLLILLITQTALSETKRIAQFSNDKVAVWETIISPGANQVLKMHRHENDRVVIAF